MGRFSDIAIEANNVTLVASFRITGGPGPTYSAEEVFDVSGGFWASLEVGRKATLRERNGNPAVPIGVTVNARCDPGTGEWAFTFKAPGSA